ncbi:hypothetical protein BKI52_10605 [marine bacterium AO1-C]|nr:hypothetical protein BKI52_10605 [marine bacterium AO1-C]
MVAIIVHTCLITAIAVIWKRFSAQAPLRLWIIPGLCLKLLGGVVVGWLFSKFYGYGGDSWNIFHNARQISALATQDFTAYIKLLFFNEYYYIPNLQTPSLWEQPRLLFIVKITSIINLATQQNYWFTSFYFSLFAFSGLWQAANTLSRLFPTTKLSAILAFILFPSVVFWSSGLQKESLALGIMAWLIHWFLSIFCDNRTRPGLFWAKVGVLSLVGLYGLWKLKFYYFGGLIPVMVSVLLAYWLYTRIKSDNKPFQALWLPLVLFVGVLGLLLLMASFMHPKLHLSEFMHVLVLNHNASFNFSAPDDLIYYYRTDPGFATLTSTVGNLLYNTPLAFVSGLFRPFIWEANNPLKLIAGLENLWMLAFTVYAVIALFFKKRQLFQGKSLPAKQRFLIIGAVIYISLLAILLALASPNLGTLVRYKVGFMSVFLYLIHIPLSYQLNSWLQRFPFLSKLLTSNQD